MTDDERQAVVTDEQLNTVLNNLFFGRPEGAMTPEERAALPPTEPPIHNHFGLSYASYLVLPRSVLQSMSLLWQTRFVTLLEELDEAWDSRPDGVTYKVQVRDAKGFMRTDPFEDYERGRRIVPLKEAE